MGDLRETPVRYAPDVVGSGFITTGQTLIWNQTTKKFDAGIISSDLEIGATAITGGVVGRVLFEGAGNILQSDAALFWDNANKRLGIGATPAINTRFDIRMQGALSTDLGLRVRNSADTQNLDQLAGNGDRIWKTSAGAQILNIEGGFGAFSDVNIPSSNNGFVFSKVGTNSVLTATTSGTGGSQGVVSFSRIGAGGGNVLHILNSNTSGFKTGINLAVDGSGDWNTGVILSASGATNNSALSVTAGNSGFGYAAFVALGARVDIKAQGALSTDIALRVRNSADTLNFLQVSGDGNYWLSTDGGSLSNSFSKVADGRMFMAKSGGNFIEMNPGTTPNRFYFPTNGLGIASGSMNTQIDTTGGTFNFYLGNLQMGSGLVAATGTKSIWMENGTAPTTNYTDRAWIYSADVVAGNAAIHFRSETGSIRRMLQETTAVTASVLVSNGGTTLTDTDTIDGYTLLQVVRALRNEGLLA